MLMKKSHQLLNEQGAEGGNSGTGESKGRKIAMDDGREILFGEKTKIKKASGVDGANVFCRIDFDNGKTILVLVPGGSLVAEAAGEGPEAAAAGISLASIGHGLEQKLGDAAAGAESTEDAFEAILEVASRLNKGVWNKGREAGSGSAKGASELVQALVLVLEQSKEAVREMLENLDQGEKAALRKVPDVAAAIEKIKAEKGPSKAEKEKLEKANSLLDQMKAGVIPPAKEETAAA